MSKLRTIIIIVCAIFSISSSQAELKTHFSVMTFNIENGGTQVNFGSVVDAIKRSGADVVGIQEAWGNTGRLAKALRWKYYDARQHIISHFPLFESITGDEKFVLIEVLPGRYVAMANMHLPDEPYGPDLIHQGLSVTKILANERGVRLPLAAPFIYQLALLAKRGTPVFLTGDFNSPSHRDWTASTVNTLPNHRYEVVWPVTKFAEQNGFVDSYRKIHSNPLKGPIYTWPANRPFIKNAIDGYNPSSRDLPDRIDFIFSAGPSKVIESKLVGEANNKTVAIAVSPWPSDHRAIVSRFEVIPSSYPRNKLTSLSFNDESHPTPKITLSAKNVSLGDPIRIVWRNAPGNRYDYISIAPSGTSLYDAEKTIHLYIHAKVNGSIVYAEKNVKGNWLSWYKIKNAHWPLPRGSYDIRLMLDDGYTILAATRIKVV